MQNTRVKNLFSTVLGVGVVAGGLVLSSCEDEFTEQDAIKAQQESLAALKEQDAKNAMEAEAMYDSLNRVSAKIDYSVTVVAANKANTGNASSRVSGVAALDGITVTVKQGGESMTATTEGGIATFSGLKSGKAVVTVGAAEMGYTSVTYTTLLGTTSDYDKEEYNVGTLIPVLPMTKETGASVVTGKAFAEFDATNDAPEAAAGATVQAVISVKSVLDKYNIASSGIGSVENATYEGFVQTATVQEDGSYELIVPTLYGDNKSGIAASIEFLPFEHDQTYVKMNEDGSLETVTEKVIFGKGSDTDRIDSELPSVYLEIEAPAGEAKDFGVKAELSKQFINIDDIMPNAGGSGYTTGNEFELSADKDGNIATFTVTADTDGKITGIETYTPNGAEYTEKPTITAKTVDGTGVSFNIDFTNKYNVLIDNVGSGYWTAPMVNMVYTDKQGLTQQIAVVNEGGWTVKDGTVGEKNEEIVWYAGSLMDEIESTTIPTFTVINPTAKQAMVDPRLVNVNDEGKITSISASKDIYDNFGNYSETISLENGAGYLTSPKVTFKVVGGEEATATGVAIVDGSEIESIKVTNPGSGISEVANDIDHEVLEDMYFQQTASPTLKPGSTTNVMNFNYGGGAK